MTRRSFQTLAEAALAYYDELKAFVLRRTGSASLAEDIAQETWIRASLAGPPVPDNARAYLYRIAGNLVFDQVRKDGRGARTEVDESGLEGIASGEPTADRVVAGREELALLVRALDELPPKCREVFLLYRGEDCTMREIAARLGLSQSSVERHVARAMLHCRRRLRESGDGS